MTYSQPAPLPRFWPLFLIALAIRIVIVLIGAVLGSTPPDVRPTDDPTSQELRERIEAGSARIIEPWYRWDAGWYVNIATNGYSKDGNDQRRLGTAFLPALPICLAAAEFVGVNPFWAGLLIVNLAASAGSAVFARVAMRLTGDINLGIRAFVLLMMFPSSFFFSAPYNEAFGLLFTALALWTWLQRQSVRAGFFAALGSLARLTGIALGAASLGSWLLNDRTRTGFKRAAILAFGSFLGLVLFWGYLSWVVGDPFAGIKAHQSWGRKELSIWNPWLSIQSLFDAEMLQRRGEAMVCGEALAALAFAVLGIRAWIKRGAFWGILTLVPTGQMMMSGTFLSGDRIVLAALPGFIEMADLLRQRLTFRVVVVVFAFVQFQLLNRYVHWVFAG
jgi:hypothetical protein